MLRTILWTMTSVALAFSVTGLAIAQGTAPPAGAPATAPGQVPPDPTRPIPDQNKPMGASEKSTADSADSMGKFMGQHSITGEVTKIDATKGYLSVKTSEGVMDLHFPPSTLSGIKKGDQVEVQLALRQATNAGKRPASKTVPQSKAPDGSR